MELFEHGGINYRLGKLLILDQVGVARRIMPLMTPLAPLLQELASAFLTAAQQQEKDGGPARLPDISPALLTTVMDEFVKLKDEDVNYVISTCMSVVQRQQGTSYAPVWNRQAKTVQFDDVELMDVLTLTFRVIMGNIGNFSKGFPSALSARPNP
jgi:hypothetical protein